MVLGRNGLTSGVIKGLTVCCFTQCFVFVLHCKHTALHDFAVCSHAKRCAGADRDELFCLLTTPYPEMQNH
ncbi:unnamed protein product, partial [Staurois parvus]